MWLDPGPRSLLLGPRLYLRPPSLHLPAADTVYPLLQACTLAARVQQQEGFFPVTQVPVWGLAWHQAMHPEAGSAAGVQTRFPA